MVVERITTRLPSHHPWATSLEHGYEVLLLGDEGIEERSTAPHRNEDLLLGHVDVAREGLLAGRNHLASEAEPAALPRSCSRLEDLPSCQVSSGTSRIFTTPSRWLIRAYSSRVVDLRGEPDMRSYTRRTHTMGLPKAIQKGPLNSMD